MAFSNRVFIPESDHVEKSCDMDYIASSCQRQLTTCCVSFVPRISMKSGRILMVSHRIITGLAI